MKPTFELPLPSSSRLGDQLGTPLPRDSHSFESIPFRTPRPHNDLPQFDFVTEYLNELNKFKSLLDCKDPKEHSVSLGRSILVDVCKFVNDKPQSMKAIDLQNLCLLLSQCSDLLQNPAAVDLRDTEELAKKLSKKSITWKGIAISFMLFTIIAITAMAITGFISFAGTTTLSLLLLGLISSKIFGLTSASLALIGTITLAVSFVPGILGCYLFFKEPHCQPLVNSVSKFITNREEQKSSLKNTENDSENSQAPTRSPSLSSLGSN